MVEKTWTTRIQTQVKKARQRLYHLRQLRKFRVSPTILKTFYSGTIESVLTQCISVWYGNSSSQDCKALQRVVRLAERICLLCPLCRTSTSNAAEAELSKSSRTQITLVTVFLLCCHLVSTSAAWWQKLRDLSPIHTARWSRKIARKLPEWLLCQRKHVPGLIPGLIPGWDLVTLPGSVPERTLCEQKPDQCRNECVVVMTHFIVRQFYRVFWRQINVHTTKNV